MHRRRIPVASIQAPAHDRKDFESAWPAIVRSVDEAGQRGAKLVVLPEGTVPGYVLGHETVADEQLASARADLAACARRHECVVVYGTALRAGEQTLNAALVIGPDGGALGAAAKRFLWHFDRRWFAPGAELEPIDTPAGKLGVLVCADGRIPTIAATLVERGAEILVMPTAWVTSGRDPAARENVQADFMMQVRARENGVPFVAANKCGIELASVAYCGKSALVAADGTYVARASESTPETVFGSLELGAQRAAPAGFAPHSPAAAPSQRSIRLAFTPATDEQELARLAAFATIADADAVIDAAQADAEPVDREAVIAGVSAAAVRWETVCAPRGLVAARLAGICLFLCRAPAAEERWQVPFARTRAAELRAYVVVFSSGARAFAVDPDGAVVAGTFDGYRLASFVYDPARTAATLVAPNTDVLLGLRSAEALRSGG